MQLKKLFFWNQSISIFILSSSHNGVCFLCLGPHEAVNIQAPEKVQWWAARWTLLYYGRHSSVTRMLTQLGWPKMQHHCFVTRLTFLYKTIHGTASLTLSSYFLPTQYPTRQHQRKHFIIPSNSTAAYQQSLYSRTIREWNNLPIAIIETNGINDFTYDQTIRL